MSPIVDDKAKRLIFSDVSALRIDLSRQLDQAQEDAARAEMRVTTISKMIGYLDLMREVMGESR
jgi:hypothetical protein